VVSWPPKGKGVESSTVLQLQSENRQGSAIVYAVSVRTGCDRAIVIPTIEVGNKEGVNDCVAESVILNKYRQHGTIFCLPCLHNYFNSLYQLELFGSVVGDVEVSSRRIC
jgi:hypothetical protein